MFQTIRTKIHNLYTHIVIMTKYRLQLQMERMSLRNRHEGAYVLMLHEITDTEEQFREAEYAITADTLKKMIRALQQQGYVFCTPDDFLVSKKSKRVLLSFDDAFEGVYTKMYPFFKKCQLPFIVFQSTKFLGQKGYLSEQMIDDMLHFEGFTLGAHTVSHCNLHECSKKQSLKEMDRANRILQDKFGKRIDFFAYPYGALVTLDIKDIINASKLYRYAFSTLNLEYKPKKGYFKYLIPRVNINEENGMSIVKQMTRQGV